MSSDTPIVTDRDREMAQEACRNWARDGAFIWGEVAKQIALARCEERARIRARIFAATKRGDQ